MKLKQLLPLSLLVLFAACNLSTINTKNVKYKSVIKNGSYKLMIPNFLDSTTRLHKEASLQFANPLKEFYVMVFDENKDNLLQQRLFDSTLQALFPDSTSILPSYFDYMTSTLSKQPNFSLFDTVTTTIKKAKAKTGSVILSLEKAKAFYRVAAVESNNNFYQVYVWTLEKHKDKYRPIMDSIINSLKEF